MFRIIQSIPSQKAEHFKQWLAQVGYERIEEIQDPELAPEGWKEVELKEVSKIITRGKSPKYVDNSDVRIINQKCIRWEKVRFQDTKFTSQQFKLDDPSILNEGDLLINSTGTGTLGRAVVFPKTNGKFIIDSHVTLLRPTERLISKYLCFYLRTALGQKTLYNRCVSGSTNQIELSVSKLSKLKIPLPPLSTQKKIVSILEKAEQAKEWRKEADKLTTDFLKAVFMEMFGDPAKNPKKWELVETQEIFDMKLGKMLSAANYTGKNLKPYLRNINVQWGYLDLIDVKEMDFDEKEFVKYKLKKGDILVCEGGEVGRTAIYNGEIEECCYQNALHRLRIKDNKINSYYFVYFMTFAAKYGLILKDTIQVTIAHFTQDKFKKFQIMFPPIELQNKFASIVKEVESMKEQQKQSKEQIDNLFNVLMQKAFKGEIYV